MDERTLEVVLTRMMHEDVGFGDLTLPHTPNKRVKAEVKARQQGMVAGVSEACKLFKLYDITCNCLVKDGAKIKKNTVILRLSGMSHNLLQVERTALNILSVMGGIATVTD